MIRKTHLASICLLLTLSSGIAQHEERTSPRTCEVLFTALQRVGVTNDPLETERIGSVVRGAAKRECVGLLLGVLEGDSTASLYATVMEVLAALGDESVIRGIEDALLRNADPAVRGRLTHVIEHMVAPTVAQYLGQTLIRSRDETLRNSISIALGRNGTPEAIKQLVNASALIEKTEWPHIVKGFALIRKSEALSELRQMLESPVPDPVREGVALALGNYNNQEVRTAIESYLRTERSEKVKEALRVSLMRVSDTATRGK